MKIIFYLFLTGWGPIYAQLSGTNEIFKIQHLDSAIVHAERHLSDPGSSGDSADQFEMICFLSRKYMLKGYYQKADKILQATAHYPYVQNNPLYKARMAIELGRMAKYKKDYPAALEYYMKAHHFFNAVYDWINVLVCKIELAEYYRRIGQLAKAYDYITEAERFDQEKDLNNENLDLKLYNRTAAIENELNYIPASIQHSLKALEIAYKLKDQYFIATSLNELGYSYKNSAHLDTAEQCYLQAEKIFIEIGADREAAHVMNNKAMLYAHNNYPDQKARKLYEKMVDFVRSHHIDYSLRDAFLYLYIEYAKLGDYQTAYNHLLLFHKTEMDRLGSLLDEKITQITERYENEKIRRELEQTNAALDIKESDLESRTRENFRIYVFLLILGLMLIAIVILVIKLQQTNLKLKKRNKEKDVFIQEIHHRVKNNLQFVSSLINMQMNASSDTTEIYSLNDASRRIKAMALVHEMLYRHGETLGVSIKQYLEELIASLNDIVNSQSIPIKFNTSIKDQDFDITSSIALGMITSELISNSIKYAFDKTEDPHIDIILEKMDGNGQMRFTVKDNGKGMVEPEDDKQKLGMRLIDIFSRQLKGTHRFFNKGGCVYEINFKIN